MPTRLKKPCPWPLCPKFTDGGYCDKHKPPATAHVVEARKEYDRERGSAASRGYGSKWRSARLGWLKKHPLCVHCQRIGIVKGATIVDHIIPHQGDKAKFWDSSNWQSLCKPHHDFKTATSDRGVGNNRR